MMQIDMALQKAKEETTKAIKLIDALRESVGTPSPGVPPVVQTIKQAPGSGPSPGPTGPKLPIVEKQTTEETDKEKKGGFFR